MGGRGPAPKRANQRGTENWTRLEPLTKRVLPGLRDIGPAPTPSGKWPFRTQMLWDSWRDDPITATWTATEIALAADTIALHAIGWDSKAGEIRLRIDMLALSPKGRRDARVLLPEEPAPEGVTEVVRAPAELRVLPEAK